MGTLAFFGCLLLWDMLEKKQDQIDDLKTRINDLDLHIQDLKRQIYVDSNSDDL